MTGSVVAVGGHPTWYCEYGDGDPLVYLHGGFSSSQEFEPAREAYAERFHVFTPDRRGQPALVTQLVLDFLTADPVPTIMPIRRA